MIDHHRFSLEILGNFQKNFGKNFPAFRQLLENLGKSSESVWKSSENRQKSCHQYLYNKENNTWLLVDMEFLL